MVITEFICYNKVADYVSVHYPEGYEQVITH